MEDEELRSVTGDDEGRHGGRNRRSMRQRFMLRLLNVYPPYLGAGVRVRQPRGDARTFEVEMKLRWWNSNYVGTHFGGSLYTMCDPFFMLILLRQLGPDFVVWDKAANIRFRRPGRGRVRARIHIPAERVDEICRQARRDGVVQPTFRTEVLDDRNRVVAEVEKILHVRWKGATE